MSIQADIATPIDSGAAKISLAERAIGFLLRPRVFVSLLVWSTVIPFFVSGLTIYNVIGAQWIISCILFLALIHVPMTVYLFFDPAIRDQMRHRRILMIGGCVFWFVVSMVAFTAFSASLGAKHTEVLYVFTFTGIMWQHWHFGKQNLGVFALSKIATKSGPVTRFERHTIVAGAICGIVAAYLMVGRSLQQQFSPSSDFSFFFGPMDFFSAQFRWFQYAIGVAAAVYIVLNFRKFTPSTAAMYFFGVCFFLPQYLAIDLPQSLTVFAQFIMGHGLQYILILLYHSLGLTDVNLRTSQSSTQPLARAAKVLAPLFFFAVSVVVALNYNTDYVWFKYSDMIARITNDVMRLKLEGPMIAGLATGFIWGILLSHFWLDSFFWRLKDKAPREWMRARFAFLFGGR
jgi:hypothetical protein